MPTRPAGGPPPRGPVPGGARPVRPTRRVHRVRRTVALVLLLVVLWLVFLVVTPFHAWQSVSTVDASPAGDRPAQVSGRNYLLVGSDSRAGLSAEQQKQLSTGDDAGQRTDSIMLVHVSDNGQKSALISLPRDSYVPIPGHNKNKINAAYSIGGPKLLVQTVERATGVRVDGYVEIGFGGFANVVDSLGGVTVNVPFDMNDEKAGINLKKGEQVLDGPQALGFVRSRYTDPEGDLGRAKRQRQFLGAIMHKAASPATVLLPWRYWGFTHAAAEGVKLGDGTSLMDVTRILQAMRASSSGDGLSLVVPISNPNYHTAAGDAVKWDSAKASALFDKVKNDQPLQ
ncbi:transcriptional regulator [Arsenicicoccus sp. oral taxon 190]|nr:transcriptional regulator [Arsenicicoccus sp. oral taxon 190]